MGRIRTLLVVFAVWAALSCGTEPRVVVGRWLSGSPEAADSPGKEGTPSGEQGDGSVSAGATAGGDQGDTGVTAGEAQGDASVNAGGDPQLGGMDSVDAGTLCAQPSAAHRYGFAGTGTEVPDSVGDAAGEALGGAELGPSGRLELDGRGDYVQLPKGLLAGLSSVTVMLWLSYDGGPAYVRVFDFGITSIGEDPLEGTPSVGVSYLALTPATGKEQKGLAAVISDDGAGSEVLVTTEARIDDGLLHQVTVVVDGEGQLLQLYLDGQLLGEAPNDVSLSSIDDSNNWLGRSQYDADPYWSGVYDEVRIFDRALSGCEIAVAWRAGPDAP